MIKSYNQKKCSRQKASCLFCLVHCLRKICKGLSGWEDDEDEEIKASK